jgi:hypothetical protein
MTHMKRNAERIRLMIEAANIPKELVTHEALLIDSKRITDAWDAYVKDFTRRWKEKHEKNTFNS